MAVIIPDPFVILPYKTSAPLYYATSRRRFTRQFTPLDRVKTYAIFGQSLGANTCSAAYVSSDRVVNLSIGDGKRYFAQDPLLGTEGNGSGGLIGNFCGQFADNLLAANFCDYVVIVPFGIGATEVADWATGVLANHIAVACARIYQASLPLDGILWYQGQADVGLGTSAPTMTTGVRRVAQNFRDAGYTDVPFFVGLSATYSGADAGAVTAVRSGQSAACSDALKIYLGPDLDLNTTPGNTWDGLHRNASGRAGDATSWANAILAH